MVQFTYNFVLQNQFLHTKFYAKNQKTKNAFLDPKRLFYTKLMKNLCSSQKVCPIKVPSEYRKNVQGKTYSPKNRQKKSLIT